MRVISRDELRVFTRYYTSSGFFLCNLLLKHQKFPTVLAYLTLFLIHHRLRSTANGLDFRAIGRERKFDSSRYQIEFISVMALQIRKCGVRIVQTGRHRSTSQLRRLDLIRTSSRSLSIPLNTICMGRGRLKCMLLHCEFSFLTLNLTSVG